MPLTVAAARAFTAPDRPYASGAAFLRGQGSGERVAGVSGLEEAQREIQGLVVESRLPLAGQAPSGTYEGDGYVILRHPETSVVERGLAALVRNIRVEVA